jgi:hypothetical protein
VELIELEAEESLPVLARGGRRHRDRGGVRARAAPAPAELHRDDLEPDELVLTLPRGLVAGDGPVALGSLRDVPWATARAGTHYADMFVRACRAAGFEP